MEHPEAKVKTPKEKHRYKKNNKGDWYSLTLQYNKLEVGCPYCTYEWELQVGQKDNHGRNLSAREQEAEQQRDGSVKF